MLAIRATATTSSMLTFLLFSPYSDNVLLDASVEEDWLLRHKAKLGPKLGHIERLNVVPLNGDTALVEVVHPLDELQDSRLATA